MINTIEHYSLQVQEILFDWITSPAAYAQFGLLVLAYLAAVVGNAWLRPRAANFLRPKDAATSTFATLRRYLLIFLPILLPLLAYAFTAVGEQVTRSVFGSGAVIALGKRFFVFLAQCYYSFFCQIFHYYCQSCEN